jgi:hypothetical protein
MERKKNGTSVGWSQEANATLVSTNQLWRPWNETHLDMHGIISADWACRKQKSDKAIVFLSMTSHQHQKEKKKKRKKIN